MKKLFTKYFFVVFVIPILILTFFYFFGTKVEGKTYTTYTRLPLFESAIARILRNPFYNIIVFYFTYTIYLLSYFFVFLIHRHTNFIFSILNFFIVVINFYLLCKNPENRILIPLTMIGFIFFIFNIFKTTKKPTTVNQQPSTI